MILKADLWQTFKRSQLVPRYKEYSPQFVLHVRVPCWLITVHVVVDFLSFGCGCTSDLYCEKLTDWAFNLVVQLFTHLTILLLFMQCAGWYFITFAAMRLIDPFYFRLCFALALLSNQHLYHVCRLQLSDRKTCNCKDRQKYLLLTDVSFRVHVLCLTNQRLSNILLASVKQIFIFLNLREAFDVSNDSIFVQMYKSCCY